ncbi:pentatricopeptide repeat-containing protein At4g02750 [Selaginella moellendorffii]|nr:pentatricopeptide repeat-containing protein At4g02750 [Selaginella moellendorffii]|eukprot:XP_002987652.2 pentatricopeptide repeat-containing protein At4g02750 [Selaginella moellendorffii]
MPEKDVAAWNAMMNLYVENQDFDSAKEIFDRMKARDVFSWTAMITAYSHSGDLESAKACFDRMKRRNSVTWNAMLAAYIRNGHTVEAESFFRKIPRPDAVSWNSIISAVAKCGDLRRARQLFDQSPEKNVVTYNTMITSFVQTNRVDLAKNFFDRMEEKDSVSWNAMITGYAQSGHLDKAREMFDRMPDRDRDPASWNSMISGYALEGRLEDAKFLFDSMAGKRNLVSWNALIAGYGQNGYGKEAINLFKKMVLEFRSELPNKVTCISVLDACASSLSLSDGRAMHARIFLYGVQSETVVGNSLINMYGKCGLLDQAARILITMPHANSISWNTLIGSYAQLGRAAIAIQLLPLMICEGFQPCQVTFSGVLSACGHGGLWSRAREFFVSMVGDFGVAPIAGHYACVIDLLGRSGLLIEAQDLLQSTPQDEISCMSIVGASRLHGDCGIGSRAALRASQIDPQSSAPYVFLSSF